MKYLMKTLDLRAVAVGLVAVALLGAGCSSAAETGGEGRPPGGQRVAGECDPNYSGACLDPNAYDYDCEGGSGDGPSYTGAVTVVGEDRHGLDADGDRRGCE